MLLRANRFAVALIGACALLGAGAAGCLSDDTAAAPSPTGPGPVEAGPTIVDASGSVDAEPGDAQSIDAGMRLPRSAGMSQAGLVAAGTVGRSPHYTMTGTAGPASAPVLRSPHYQFVGGVSVTSQQP